jgi:hypothetical protein
VLEPTAPALTQGLAGVWSDPTVDSRATGLFFGVSHASYASVQVFHGALAFRLGPRWSVAYSSAGLGDLFDSSLTNQDPSLANLRAQAAWGLIDATFSLPRLATSLGLAIAGDDNVGVFQSSTMARVHLRVLPFKTRRVTIGARGSRPFGGSVPASAGGRGSIDVTVRQTLGRSALSVTAAASRGSLWRYSETDGGYAVAAEVSVLSQLDLGAAVGRYHTTYGTSPSEAYRSVTAAVRVDRLRFGARYTSTRLGTGSGFGLSLAYETRSAREALP